mmetsp:Transcript_3778/g.8778  ORF Transcript_3778/g.8778 Transcript_3778/m.8778 type:complete len:490 (-) Transcript_3778:233-1702(-)
MPLDKARIQGFGSDGPAPEKPPQCPEGHELQLWAARSGKCDGCSKKVQTGEQVMDCRRCNWYLCNQCCPQNKAQDSTLWGAISSLPFYVLDDMSEMATDIETFVSTSVFDQTDKEGKVLDQKQEPPVSPRQKAESSQVVTDFCEKYPALRVIPNEMDLDVFWAKCSVLHPRPVADAIYDQLSFSGGDNDWQPRLRALYALEHLHQKGGAGRDITRVVLHAAKGLLQHLVEVPQCSQKATQVMATLRGTKPAEVSGPADKAPASAGSPATPPKVTARAPDLLDAPPPQQAAGKSTQDLLDLPLGLKSGSPQVANDLLDLTTDAAPSAVGVSSPSAPWSMGIAPGVPVTPAPATLPVVSHVGSSTAAPAPQLADLYALYPKCGQIPVATVGPKDSTSTASPLSTVGPASSRSALGISELSRPSVQARGALGTKLGQPSTSSSSETCVDPAPKGKGLESLLSESVAGLGNMEVVAQQPPRQATGMHRVLAAH